MGLMQTGVQEMPEGMLGELVSLLGLGSTQFGWMRSPSATAGEKFEQNLTLGTISALWQCSKKALFSILVDNSQRDKRSATTG